MPGIDLPNFAVVTLQSLSLPPPSPAPPSPGLCGAEVPHRVCAAAALLPLRRAQRALAPLLPCASLVLAVYLSWVSSRHTALPLAPADASSNPGRGRCTGNNVGQWGWKIDWEGSVFWRWLNYVQWENPVTNAPTGSYSLWLVFFYLLACVLCISIALCVYVARCARVSEGGRRLQPPARPCPGVNQPPVSGACRAHHSRCRRAPLTEPPALSSPSQLLPLRSVSSRVAREASQVHRLRRVLGEPDLRPSIQRCPRLIDAKSTLRRGAPTPPLFSRRCFSWQASTSFS